MNNDYFSYNKTSGRLRARTHSTDKFWNRSTAGREFEDGTQTVKYQGAKWQASHIIWFLIHGVKPKAICYIDGDSRNLKLSNLLETRSKAQVTQIDDGKFKTSWRGKSLGVFKTGYQATRAKIKAMKTNP